MRVFSLFYDGNIFREKMRDVHEHRQICGREPVPQRNMYWMEMNKNCLIIGCAGLAVLAFLSEAGSSRSLETGRAAGYDTHSGDGARSAGARFECFKERRTPSGSTSSVTVAGEDGKRYEVDVEDPEARARAAPEAWGADGLVIFPVWENKRAVPQNTERL